VTNWSCKTSSQIAVTNKPTPSFLQAGCPSCCPTNSVKALKGSLEQGLDGVFKELRCTTVNNSCIQCF